MGKGTFRRWSVLPRPLRLQRRPWFKGETPRTLVSRVRFWKFLFSLIKRTQTLRRPRGHVVSRARHNNDREIKTKRLGPAYGQITCRLFVKSISRPQYTYILTIIRCRTRRVSLQSKSIDRRCVSVTQRTAIVFRRPDPVKRRGNRLSYSFETILFAFRFSPEIIQLLCYKLVRAFNCY